MKESAVEKNRNMHDLVEGPAGYLEARLGYREP